MAEKSKTLELKVGIFVFCGLIVLAWFVLWIGDFKIIKQGYNMNAVFGFANGIKVGAPVRLAGVEKGEVKEIILLHNHNGQSKVIVKAWLAGDSLVPRDSRIWVNTLGLLGEKYLEIIPGQDYSHLVQEGDTLAGEDPTSVQEVTELLKDAATQAEHVMNSMQKTLDSMTLILDDVHDGRGTVGKLFSEDKLYTDLEEMFADLKAHPWKLLYRPKEPLKTEKKDV
ncbi:MAG: MlaD family protein [Candidatus Omnitrophota bacterium]